MALRFVLLGSGSSGNSTLVSAGDRHVLVDVGLSAKETSRRLTEYGVAPERISAVVVSHEHSDHCRGVGPFARAFGMPVFMTDGAYTESGMRLEEKQRQRIASGIAFEVEGMVFTPFAVPHDSVDPIAFTIEKGGAKIGIVVDLGYVTNLVIQRLKGCDGIVLESNHDTRMLQVGPYPWALKQRVMSRRGHLSNDNVAHFLAHGFDGKARHIVLAHLSKSNNLPELAVAASRRALEERCGLFAPQTRLELASAETISAPYRY